MCTRLDFVFLETLLDLDLFVFSDLCNHFGESSVIITNNRKISQNYTLISESMSFLKQAFELGYPAERVVLHHYSKLQEY